MLNIVLFEPEIPSNTGNIGRTCAATGARLHLIEPLGFSLSEKALKRAGMDYWKELDVTRYLDFEEFLERNQLDGTREIPSGPEDFSRTTGENGSEGGRGPRLFFATTKGHHLYSEEEFGPDDYIMFGPESRGIPEEILKDHEAACIRIPMLNETRSLNLANSAAIVLYEALRQQGFPGLKQQGELTKYEYQSSR